MTISIDKELLMVIALVLAVLGLTFLVSRCVQNSAEAAIIQKLSEVTTK